MTHVQPIEQTPFRLIIEKDKIMVAWQNCLIWSRERPEFAEDQEIDGNEIFTIHYWEIMAGWIIALNGEFKKYQERQTAEEIKELLGES